MPKGIPDRALCKQAHSEVSLNWKETPKSDEEERKRRPKEKTSNEGERN